MPDWMETDVGLGRTSPNAEATVEDQAAAWLARRRSGSWSAADESEFTRWLNSDPSHSAAWTSLGRVWERVETVRDDPRILEIRERARQSAARHPTHWHWRLGGALAASLVGAFLIWRAIPRADIPLAHEPRPPPTALSSEPATALIRDASTEVGERSLVLLPDGSKLTLNTSSAIHADFTGRERRVTLLRGEAFFDVAKDPTRPFVVAARSRNVIAVGTAFDVNLQAHQVRVNLVEGKVRIERAAGRVQPAAAVMLEAGFALVAPEAGSDQVERFDTARTTSWRSGRLIFDGQNLADVVAEMNRYSREKIEIADPALESRKVSGVFESTGGAGFASALETYGIAHVTRRTANRITLESPE
jgi:transmembrane sensor